MLFWKTTPERRHFRLETGFLHLGLSSTRRGQKKNQKLSIFQTSLKETIFVKGWTLKKDVVQKHDTTTLGQVTASKVAFSIVNKENEQKLMCGR